MSSRYSGTVVTVVGSRRIVGCSGIDIMSVVGDFLADLVDSKLT